MDKPNFEKCLRAWMLDPGYKLVEEWSAHEDVEKRIWAIHAAYCAGFRDAGGEVK